MRDGTIMQHANNSTPLSPLINPHPPLQKWPAVFIAPALEAHLGYLTSWRLPWQLWVAAHIVLAFHLIRKNWGWRTAAIFGLALFGMPRLFTYLSMGIQDGLLAISWLNTSIVGSKLESQSPRRDWALFTALVITCAATKVTGFLVVIPVGILLLAKKDWKGIGSLCGVAMAAAIFAVAIDPSYWNSSFWNAPLRYILYPLERKNIPISIFYLNKMYAPHAPWHWGPAIIGATTPPLGLALLILGVFGTPCHSKIRKFAPFLGVWILLIVTPIVPRHDDIRQFLPGILIMLLCGAAILGHAVEKFKWRAQILLIALIALIFSGVDSWLSTWRFPLSYYSPLVGNLEGAEKKGFDITLYFEALNSDVLNTLNENLPQNAKISHYPDWDFTLTLLQNHGLLRKDIRIEKINVENLDSLTALIYYHRKSVINEASYRSGRNFAEVRFRGVSMIRILRQPKWIN